MRVLIKKKLKLKPIKKKTKKKTSMAVINSKKIKKAAMNYFTTDGVILI